MARLFSYTSNQYLSVASAVLTTTPMTMACWFYSTHNDLDQTLINISDNTAGQYDGFWLSLAGHAAGDYVRANTYGSGHAYAVTATGYTISAWQHACGVWSAADARAVYLNGANKGTDSGSQTPAGIDITSIGISIFDNSTLDTPMNGRMAEVGIWNVALTDAEAAVLAKGISPRSVRPESLVFYLPLVRDDDEDVVGGLSLTAVNGPTVVVHPRVFYLATPQIGKTGAIAEIIAEIATVSWANVGKFAGVAEAAIAQIAGVIAN